MSTIENVSIKFKPGAYNLFRSLKYRVWLALAEYVDNSVQSYLSNKRVLYEDDPDYKFQIKIKYRNDFIQIWDNAAGINTQNILRAFEPANIPDNNKGLNEFGMGMKTASIWLSERWSVRTAAIGEIEERLIEFDLNDVTSKNKEELPVQTTSKDASVHFTEVTLCQLTDNGKNRQPERIKKHITSIHRNLIRSGELYLEFNGEPQIYKDPNILVAPYFKTNGDPIYWKQDINYELGKYKVKGFIAILERMSTSQENGFSLFRRGRVIEGSHDEKYRPKSLCGQVGSPQYKRIFGELELEGFEVSFDKGSFRNPDELDYFLEQLKIEISQNKNNIFQQAQYYKLPKAKDDTKKAVQKTIEKLKKEQEEKEEYPDNQFDEIVDEIKNSPDIIPPAPIISEENKIDEIIDIKIIDGCTYTLKIQFVSDKNISDFYTLGTYGNSPQILVNCSINLAHPFFLKYESFQERGDYSPILQIVKNLVYAELTASMVAKNAGYVRMNFNKFIRNL